MKGFIVHFMQAQWGSFA